MKWLFITIILLLVPTLIVSTISQRTCLKYFGTSYKTEILKFFIFLIGSFTVIGTLIVAVETNKLSYTNNQLVLEHNKLIQKGQLDTRFKDAALLMSNENTSAILSGIHALHQIAIESSTDEKQPNIYANVISNMFCSYIEEISDLAEIKYLKPKIIIDEIINKLFIDGAGVYLQYEKNINNALLLEVQFFRGNIHNLNIRNSYLKSSFFHASEIMRLEIYDSVIDSCFFNENNAFIFQAWNSQIDKVHFLNGCYDFSGYNCDIKNSIFQSPIHDNSILSFTNGKISNSHIFTDTKEKNVYINFKDIDLVDVSLKNMDPNCNLSFDGTIFSDYDKDYVINNAEIISFSGDSLNLTPRGCLKF